MSHPSESKYPTRLSYVLKLRSESTSAMLAGRLENVVTGRRVEFASGHELLDAIAHEIGTAASEPPAERV